MFLINSMHFIEFSIVLTKVKKMLHYFRVEGACLHLSVRLDVSVFYRSLRQESLLPGVVKQQLLSRSKGEMANYSGKALREKQGPAHC